MILPHKGWLSRQGMSMALRPALRLHSLFDGCLATRQEVRQMAEAQDLPSVFGPGTGRGEWDSDVHI